ncbi:hypothetical protein TNCT_501551 [Trichonephila clavata]|uniref:Uncharacterized protein n=1 Tax=Trichonephila clavata TaxID=2740835 RepID=A0A8X6GZ96_TRICU|nr:hypothetical protein TNCT_501551 [Trichonephila clavata]
MGKRREPKSTKTVQNPTHTSIAVTYEMGGREDLTKLPVVSKVSRVVMPRVTLAGMADTAARIQSTRR